MSFGTSVGRTIGASAAYVGHAAVVATKATGTFGADIASGTAAGYAEHSARLAAQRAGVERKAPLKRVIRAKATA